LERPAFHSAVINSSGPDRAANAVVSSHPTKTTPTKGSPTSQQPLTTAIRYRGSQVYAQRSDGRPLWTVWADGVLAAPPRIRGDFIYLTTLLGSQYTLRAGDGEILSLVTAAMQQDNQHSNGPDKGNKHHHHHHQDNNQGDGSSND